VELGTVITSGKKRTNLQDPQEDPGTGICEASKRDVQQVKRSKHWTLWRGRPPLKQKKEQETEK
jgi:hypothetical protein